MDKKTMKQPKKEKEALPEWGCQKELPCSCRQDPQPHKQTWMNKMEYRWVCRTCGNKKYTM